jgi:hypothetical protein
MLSVYNLKSVKQILQSRIIQTVFMLILGVNNLGIILKPKT